MRKYLSSSIFLIFIFMMGILIIPNYKADYSENEKRYYADFPSLSVSGLKDGSYTDKLDDFLSDHIPFRDIFTGINAYFSLAEGRNSVNEVYVGKDGYLFDAPNTNGNEIFKNNISKFESFATKNNIKSTLIMVPRNGYIMKSKLFNNHLPYNDDELYDIANKLTNNIKIVDVRNILKANAPSEDICYKTDHHLTANGNYLIYKEFSDNQNTDYKKTSYQNFSGSVMAKSGYWLNQKDTLETWDDGGKYDVLITETGEKEISSKSLFFPKNDEHNDKYPIFLDGNHSLVKIQNPSGEKGNLLIIKDSYAQCFATFLASDYNTITMVDMRYYRMPITALIKENNIDEVLYMYGISTLLTDTNSGWIM